ARVARTLEGDHDAAAIGVRVRVDARDDHVPDRADGVEVPDQREGRDLTQVREIRDVVRVARATGAFERVLVLHEDVATAAFAADRAREGGARGLADVVDHQPRAGRLARVPDVAVHEVGEVRLAWLAGLVVREEVTTADGLRV